jgi:hypothetical protein
MFAEEGSPTQGDANGGVSGYMALSKLQPYVRNGKSNTKNLPGVEDRLIFADARLTLGTTPDPAGLVGTIEWQGGGLNLNGTRVKSLGATEIAKRLNIGRASVYRMLAP